MRVDGIIGWDVIRQLDIVMDFQNGRVIINRPVRLGTNGTAFQNMVWLGKPLVEVRTKGGTLHFTLDTGAQATFLSASLLERVGARTRALHVRMPFRSSPATCTATVTAIKSTDLLVLDCDDFHRFIDRNPEVGARVREVAQGRVP